MVEPESKVDDDDDDDDDDEGYDMVRSFVKILGTFPNTIHTRAQTSTNLHLTFFAALRKSKSSESPHSSPGDEDVLWTHVVM